MPYSKLLNISGALGSLDQEGDFDGAEWFIEECLEGISILLTGFDFKNINKIAFWFPEV